MIPSLDMKKILNLAKFYNINILKSNLVSVQSIPSLSPQIFTIVKDNIDSF